MLACCCAADGPLMARSRESRSVCLGVVSQIKNFIKRSHVQLLNRRNKERVTIDSFYLSSWSRYNDRFVRYLSSCSRNSGDSSRYLSSRFFDESVSSYKGFSCTC